MSEVLTPNPAIATGKGDSASVLGSRSIAVLIEITGAPTAVTVDIEGGIAQKGDTTKVIQLAQHVMSAGELTAGFAMFFILDKPVSWINYNVINLVGGVSPTVKVSFKAF